MMPLMESKAPETEAQHNNQVGGGRELAGPLCLATINMAKTAPVQKIKRLCGVAVISLWVMTNQARRQKVRMPTSFLDTCGLLTPCYLIAPSKGVALEG